MTRDQLRELFRQKYPPMLAEVLRLDHSLLDNKEFLQPYPQLAAFLSQHPEVARNPSFFLGNPAFGSDNEADAARVVRNFMEPFSILLVFATIASAIVVIVKSAIDYRRWSRAAQAQSDIHLKLMDRFTASQELLAYIQTPSGQRFLDATPISLNGNRRVAAPINRILWSVQIGVVAGSAGLGMQYIARHFQNEVAEPFFVLGTLGIALGIGFIVSALISYFISRGMGLLNSSNAETAPPT